MAARFADSTREAFLIKAELFDQAGKTFGLFDGVQVFALQVFNQAGSHRHAVIEIANNNGHIMQLGDLRRAPAAFTTDDLVTPSVTRLRAHKQGLQNAVFGDGSSEFLQRLTVRFHARLKGAGFDHGNRQAARWARSWGGRRRRITHEGGETHAEPGGLFHWVVSFGCFSRRIHSCASAT